VLDEERCILCSRCVRFTEEITGRAQLTVEGLGSRSVINTFMDRPLTGNYQGNLADICPVGALTLKPFRFQARVWNLTKTRSTCGECSRGCSITVEALRGKQVKRFRPRYEPEVNDWWMCDVGRFAFAPVTMPLAPEGRALGGSSTDGAPARLRGACVRGYGGLELAEVEDALDAAADRIGAHPDRALVLSPFATIEEANAALGLARALGATPTFVSPAPNGLADDLLHTGDPCPNRRGLVELGFEPLEPARAIEVLASKGAAVIAGERVIELLGPEALAALPASLRLVAFDVAMRELPALDVGIAVPTHVEKAGHWVNVDGHQGVLEIALQPPPRVEPLERTLAGLARRVAAIGTESGAARSST
jgi:NADH-quinone oxidoreductase subunit G